MPKAPKLTVRAHCSWTCYVHMLDHARNIGVDFSHDRFERLADRILRLKYVDDINTAHQFWCRIDPETSDPKVAERRVQNVLAKIDRLLMSHRRSQ